ncbi:hypothetical protein GmHk_06G015077 [Glycine max]|nr:hypothetical protein GmHk_06G015077 [Glycine max]
MLWRKETMASRCNQCRNCGRRTEDGRRRGERAGIRGMRDQRSFRSSEWRRRREGEDNDLEDGVGSSDEGWRRQEGDDVYLVGRARRRREGERWRSSDEGGEREWRDGGIDGRKSRRRYDGDNGSDRNGNGLEGEMGTEGQNGSRFCMYSLSSKSPLGADKS